MWEIARDSHVLDVNSSYAYVLWCADHHRTSLVAEVDGRVAGFVTGYIRPDHPQALMIWQIAVDAEARGLGIAANMLDHLMTSVSGIGIVGLTNSSAGYGNSTVTEMHTTISPDNSASVALFTSLAQRREMTITRGDFLDARLFPGDHEPEDLYILRPAS